MSFIYHIFPTLCESISNGGGSLLLCHYFQKFSGFISSVLKELSLTLTLIKIGAFVFISTGFRKNPLMFNYILP